MQGGERAGLLYVLAGFSTLSIGDAVVKGMVGAWSAPAIALTRFAGAALVLGVLLARREGLGALALPRQRLQWVRGLALATGSVSMFMAVWALPLATATTIAFTQPMITALLGAAVLGEPARRSTLVASLVAFAGVVLVLRPNFASAGLYALLPVLNAMAMAVMIIANRASAAHGSVLRMQYTIAVTALAVLAPMVPLLGWLGLEPFRLSWPAWSVIARALYVGLNATVGHWLIYMGTLRAGAGAVAPMTYGQLLAAGLLGAIFFGEVPDLVGLTGAAVIIGAGLFLWWNARRPVVMAPPD